MNTARLLTSAENCDRKGVWASQWERLRLDGAEMVQDAIRTAATQSEREDVGEFAGERVMELAEERGLETSSHGSVYDSVIHHACLADILTTAIKTKPEPWGVPEPLALPGGHRWQSSAMLDPSGTKLRRVVLVTAWGDDRHYAEARSWFALGEVCAYRMPMQQAVLVIGPHREGRRHSPWTKGLLHPHNHKLRFRRKNGAMNGFKDSWERVWREQHAEIDRRTWLQTMLDDDVLRDVCFTVEIPYPGDKEAARVMDMASRRLDRIFEDRPLPDQQLSTCDWPVRCVFQKECHAGKQPTEGRFVPISL